MELGHYQHYKGTLYYVVSVAQHTETSEEMVIYFNSLDTHPKYWVRPLIMFLENVIVNGIEVPRFKKVTLPETNNE